MKVLSLFDGISCGMVALERAGIPVERYVAYEIDKYAIQVSEKNYPQIEHCGDVFDGDYTEYQGFDLLIGGSPCTYWSIARNNREVTPDGLGGKLFMQYVRALKESKCKYFLYENNYSIHKDIKTFISEQLGVEPIMINSSLVSAQQRKRCYWTNIPNVKQPNDKGVLLKDILQSGLDLTGNDKSYCLTASYNGAVVFNTIERKQRTMIAEPVACAFRGRYNTTNSRTKKVEGGTYQAFEARKDNKSNAVTTVHKDCMVCEPVRLGHINKTDSQGNRVYSERGKSVCLQSQSGGLGAKTGLYLCLIDENKQTNKLLVYKVENGIITVKDRLYPVTLSDGLYIIRKLTPIEAERLQTLPDDYTEGISNTQRYKCLGNGWTVDVIKHIFGGIKDEK